MGRASADNDDRGVGRWHRRPVLAGLVRGLALVAPIGAGIAGGAALGRILPRPTHLVAFLLSFALVTAGSMGIAWAVDRIARRLLPLAALLNLSLLFPDHAPSRYKVALRAGSVRSLQRQVEAAKAFGIGGDRVEAAQKIIELSAALNAHDRLTRGHAERVRAYTDLLAAELKLSPEDRDRLHWAALLHDVGKIFVHPHILNKAGKPDEHEWEVLRRHPEEGGKLAAPLAAWLGPWSLAIAEHHESYDGRGYPRALAGEEISYGARIVAVADAYDVMTSTRSYKKPMPAAAARLELTRCAGKQFDPVVVRAFLNIGLGRLRWAMGPLSSIFQLPTLGRFEGLAPQLGWLARAAAGVAAVASGGLLTMDAPPAPAPTELATTGVAPDYQPLPGSLFEHPTARSTAPAEAPQPTTVPAPAPSIEAEPAPVTVAPAAPASSAAPSVPRPATTTTTTTRPAAPAPTRTPTPTTAPTATTVPPPAAPAPAPVRDLALDGREDEPLVIGVLGLLGVDADTLDPASLGVAAAASSGTVLADGGTGVLTYVPDPGFVGLDRFRYRGCTPAGPCGEAAIAVTIADVPYAPVAVPDSVVIDEDDPPVVLAVLDNDHDADGAADLDGGTLAVVADPTLGTVAVAPGRLVYTPNPDVNGVDQLTYRICDRTERCDDGKVHVTIQNVNDPPVFTLPASLTVAEDSGASTLTAVLTVAPGPPDEHNQHVDFAVAADPGGPPGLLTGPPTINASGRVTVTTATDAHGSVPLRITATDAQGAAAAAVTTLVVTPAEDAPVASADAATTAEDTPVTVPVLANDTDVDGDALVVASATAPDGGTATVETDGSVTFTPPPDASGTFPVTYTADDGRGGTDPATLTVTVTPVDDAPAATADTATTAEDTPVTVAVLANDADPDVDGQALTVTSATGPTTVNADGTVTYTPPADANGPAAFTYTVTDGTSAPVTATVDVTITPVDDPPVWTPGPTITVDVATSSATTRTGWATAIAPGPPTATDELTQTLAFTLTPGDASLFDPAGMPTLDADGTLHLVAAGTPGSTVVTATLADDGGATTTTTFTVQFVRTHEHVLVSEYAASSASSNEDEFVELFNPTAAPVDLSGHRLLLSKDDGNLESVETIPAGTVLPVGGHYLLAGKDFAGPSDQALTGKIGIRGGFRLEDPSGQLLDGVGTAPSPYHEGTPLPPLADGIDQSYERRDGGSFGSCIDADDNATDFVHHQAAALIDAQHLGSPLTPCTATPPVPPTTASGLVVSELRPEGPGGGEDEFVELFNAGPTPIALAGWRVAFRDGGNLDTAYTFDAGTVAPGAHVLLVGRDWTGEGSGLTPDGRYGTSGGILGGLLDLLGLGADTDLRPRGTVILYAPGGAVADEVGLAPGEPGGEGRRLLELDQGLDTYERRAGDDLGSCVDTGDNAADFRHRLSGSGYQNLASDPTPCG